MKTLIGASWLILALAGCTTAPEVAATWYLSRNCDRLMASAEGQCRGAKDPAKCLETERESEDMKACENDIEPKLYIGLLNRSNKSISFERLEVNGKSYPTDQPSGTPTSLDPGRIVFFDLHKLDLPSANGGSPYWRCHLPVVATLKLGDGKTLGVESISTMPSTLTPIWRTRCVFPPI